MWQSKKIYLHQKGFTLIEIILATAILGILAAAFLPFLGNGMSGIFRSSQRGDALYQAQSKIEKATGGTETAKTISITPPSGTSIPLAGKIRTVTETINGNTVTLYIFEPNP